MATVIYVGGGKGGVGKSLVSMAAVDLLRTRKQAVTLVEGDQANPDVYKCYQKLIPVQTCDFDVEDGWNDLGELAEKTTDRVIVVNSGARVIEGVRKYGYVLEDCAQAGIIDLVVLWPINRLRDSVTAIRDFRTAIPSGKLAVIRNLFFGQANKFTRWNESKYAHGLVAARTAVCDLEELSDPIVDKIYDRRMPIEEVVDDGLFVHKSNARRWREKTHSMLASIIP